MNAKRTCCIVGLAPSPRLGFLHEPLGTEIWTLNNAFKCFTQDELSKFTRWFQIHPKEEWEATNAKGLEDYRNFLNSFNGPVYMDAVHPDYPKSVRYPLEEIIQDLGYDYFTSSIAYLIALAIFERFDEMILVGIEMVFGTEYVHERPCVEFWLGVAHARGIELRMPEGSTLLRGPLYGRQVSIPSSIVKNAMDEWAQRRENRRLKWSESIGMVGALGKLAVDRPEDEVIAKMLAEAVHEEAVAMAEYNAFSGGVQALEDVLIDALRPETEQRKNMRNIKGDALRPDYYDPLLFRRMVDSVNHPADLMEARTMVAP